ncbi:uncharacterized protein LOC130644310 isoform X2 [Hydractinia symbiolongicarpus]|uniref:uncharacterized protein LOC130644310 isoform X2 n=1 Tax=Hydractinia symbiolongicarpus TaxID=13093 RepID=UPI00254DE558|nr:uncharacterized protein LOC130644310 isoform X2 [Hydractinia symbiolongicarpus]
MKNLREFTLVTKDNQTAYLPGDVIHGELYVSFDEPITMKSMRVCLFGEGAGTWLHQEDASYADASKDSDGKLMKQTLVDVGLLVFGYAGDKDENTETHENGRYVYAFEFNVPKNLPCTFKSPIEKDLGFAKYSLQAIISRPKKYDKVTKLAIVINKLINPEHIPSNITPGAMKDASVVNSACMPVGTLSFESYLPQLCYTQGDNIQIHANAENNSPKVMKEIYAKLIRRVRCKSKFGSSTYTMEETKVHGPRIPSEQKFIWDNQKMRIPSIGSTVTGNNDDIRVDYIVRVGMHEDKGSEIHLDLPVIIGTIGNKEDEDKEEKIEDNLFDRNQHNYGLQVIKAAERDNYRETLKDKLDKSGTLPQINSESKMSDDNIRSKESRNKGEDTADGYEAYRSFDDSNRSRVKIFDDDINIALSDADLDITIGDDTFNSARDENDGRSKSAAGRPIKKIKNQIGKERSASADGRLKTPKDGSAERGRVGSGLSSKGLRQKSASPLGSRGSMGSIKGKNGSKGKLNESNGSLRKTKSGLKGSSQSLKSNGSKGANKGKSGKDDLENSTKSLHGSQSSLMEDLIAGMDSKKDGETYNENKWEIPRYVPNAIDGEDKNAGFRDANQWNNTPNSRNELENSPSLLHGASTPIKPITEDVQAFAEEGDLHAGLEDEAYLNKLDENSPKLLYGDYPIQNQSNDSAGAHREPITEDVQAFAEEGDLHAGPEYEAYLNKLDVNSSKILSGDYPIQNQSKESAGAQREPITEDVESPIIPLRKNNDHATVDDEEYLREFERLEQEFQAKSPSAQKRMQESRPIPVEHTEEQGSDQLLNGGYEVDGEYQSYSQHPMSPITEEKEEAVAGTGLDGTQKVLGGELKTSTPASNAISNDHNNLHNLKDNASADPGNTKQHVTPGNDDLQRKDDGDTDGEKKVGDHQKDEKKTGLSSPWGIVGMIDRLLGRKKKEEDKEDRQTPLKKTDADSAATASMSENQRENTQQTDKVNDKERTKLPEKIEGKRETSEIQGMLDAIDGGKNFDKQEEHKTPSKDPLNTLDSSGKVGEGEDVQKSNKAAEQDKGKDVQKEIQEEGDLKHGDRRPFFNDQTNGISNSETKSTKSEDQSECDTNTDMPDIPDEDPEEDSLEDINQQNNLPSKNSESIKDQTNTIMKNKTKSTKPKTGPNKKEKLEASQKLGKQGKNKSENIKKILPLKPGISKKPKAVAKKPASEAGKKGKGIRIPTSIPATKHDSSFSSDSFFSSHSSSESDDEQEKRTSKLKQAAGELYGDSTQDRKTEREKGKHDRDKVAGPREARNEKKQCNDMFPEDEGYGTIGRQKDKKSPGKGQGKDNEKLSKPNQPSSKRPPLNKISNIKPQDKPVSEKHNKANVSKNPAKVQDLSPSQSPAKEKIKKPIGLEDKRLKKHTTIPPKASKISSKSLPSKGSTDKNGVKKLKKSPDTASPKLKEEKPLKQSEHIKEEEPTQNKVTQKRHPSAHTSSTDKLPYVASPNHISDQYYPDHHNTDNDNQEPGDSPHHPNRSSSPIKSKQDPTSRQQHGSATEKIHQHDPCYNDPARVQQSPEDLSRGGNRSSSPIKSKQDPTSRQQHSSAPEKIHQHDPYYNDPARVRQRPKDTPRGVNRPLSPTKSKQDPTSNQQHGSAPEKVHQYGPYYNDPARVQQTPEDISRGGNRSSSPTKSKQYSTSRQQHSSAPKEIHQHDPYYNDRARVQQTPEDIQKDGKRFSSPNKSKQDPTSRQQHSSAPEKIHQHDLYYIDPARVQQTPEDILRGGNRSSSPTKSKQDPTSRQQHSSAPEKIHQHDPYYNDPARVQQTPEDISRGGNRSSSPTKSKQGPTSRQQHSSAPEKIHQHDSYYNDPARVQQTPEDISRGGNRSSSPTKSKQDPTSRQQHSSPPEKIHQHDPYYNDPARVQQTPEDISRGGNRSSSPAKSKQDPTSRQQHSSAPEKIHQHDPYYNDPARVQQTPEDISRGGNRSSSPTKSKQDPTSRQQHSSAPEKIHQDDPYYNDPARVQQTPEDISRGGNRSSSPTKSKQDPTSRQQHSSAPAKIHQHDPYYNDPARVQQTPEDISRGGNRSSSPTKSKQDPTSRQHSSAPEKIHQYDPYYNDPAKAKQSPEDLSRGGNRSLSPNKCNQDQTSRQQHSSAPVKIHQHDPYYNDPARVQQTPEDISRGGNRSSSPAKSKQDPTSRQQHSSAPEKIHQHDPYYNDPARVQQTPEDISRGGNRSSSPTKSKQDPTSRQQHSSAPEKIHQHDPYYNDPARVQQTPEDISRGGNRSSSPNKSNQDPTSCRQHSSAPEKIHQHDPYYNDPARVQQRPKDISKDGNRYSSPTKSKQYSTSRQQHGPAPKKIHQHDPYYNDPARVQQTPEDISRGGKRSSSPTKSKQYSTTRQQHGPAPEKIHQHDPYNIDRRRTQQRPEDLSQDGKRPSSSTNSKQDPYLRQSHDEKPANGKHVHQSPNRQKKDQIWSAKIDDGFYDPYLKVHESMPKDASFIPSQVPDIIANVKYKSPKTMVKTKKTPQDASRTPEKMDKKGKQKKQTLAFGKDNGSKEETKSNNRKTKVKEEKIHNKKLLSSTAKPIKEKVTYSDDEKVPLNDRYIPIIQHDKIHSGGTGDTLLQTNKNYPKIQGHVNLAETSPTKKAVNKYGHNDKTKNTQSKNQSQNVTKKPYVSPYRQIPKSKKRVTPPEHAKQLREAQNDLHPRPDELVGLEAMLEKGVKIGPELSMDKNNEESMRKGKNVSSSRYGSGIQRSPSAPNAPEDLSSNVDMSESKDRYVRMKSEDAEVLRSQCKPKNDAKGFSSSWNGPRDYGYMESRGRVLPYVGHIERIDHDKSVSLEDIDRIQNKYSSSFEKKPAGISPVHSNSFDFVLVPPYATETVTLHGGNEDVTLEVVLDEIKTKQPTQDKKENQHIVIKDETNSETGIHTADAITEATKSGNENKTQKKQTDLPLKKTERDIYENQTGSDKNEDEGGNKNCRVITESLTLPPVPTESTKVPEGTLKLPLPPAKTESKKDDTKTDRNLNINKPSLGGFVNGGFSVETTIPSREKIIVPVNYFPLTRSPPTTKKQNQTRQTSDDVTSRARSASPQKRSYKTEKEKRSRSLSPIQFKTPDETSQKTDSSKQKPPKISNNNTQKSKIPLRSPRDATQKANKIAQTTTTSSTTKIKSPRSTQGEVKTQIDTGGDHNLSTSLDHSTYDERVVIGGGLIFNSPKKSLKRTIVARERKSKVRATSSSKIREKEKPPRSRSKIIDPTYTLKSSYKQPNNKKQKDEVDELIELALKEEIKRSKMDGTEPYKEPTTSCGFAGSIPRIVAYDVPCSPIKERRTDEKKSSTIPYQTERNTQQTQSITSSKQTFDFVGVTPSYENKVNLTRFEKKQKEELMSGRQEGKPMFEENYIHQAQEKQNRQQGVVIMRKPPKSDVRPLRSKFKNNSQLDTNNKTEILATKIPQWYKQTTPAGEGVNHLKVRSRDDSFDSFEHHEKLLGIVDEHGKLKRKRGLLESILGEDEYEELQIRKSRVQRRRYKRFLEDLETVKHGRPASCPGAIGPREGWFEISDQMYGDINSSETGTEYTSDDEHYARIQLTEPQQKNTDDTKLHRTTPYHSIPPKGTHVDFPLGGFGYEEEILETYQFIEERERKR